MKAFVALFVVLSSFAAQAESMYVFQRGVSDGRAVSNFPIHDFSDVRVSQLFGMDQEADEAIAALEYSKAYKCEIDGRRAYINSGDSRNSSQAALLKVYSISGCTEVKKGEVLKAILDQDRIDTLDAQ